MMIKKSKIFEKYENLSKFFILLKESLDKKFSIVQLIDHLKALAKLRGMKEEILPCFIQKFCEGIPCIITKEDGKVRIKSASDEDITSKFSNISKKIASMEYEKIIIEAVVKEEKPSVAICYDVLWDPFENCELKTSGYNSRLGIFRKVKFKAESGQIKEACLDFADASFVKTEEDFKKAVDYFSKAEGSKGIIVKHSNFTESEYNINTYIISESMHSRKECMSCSKPPTVEVLWANGKGHIWFCEAHYKIWEKEHKGDIDSKKLVKDGEAAMKFKDNINPNILKAAKFALQHQWWVNPEVNQFNLIIDEGKETMLNIVADASLVENDSLTIYTKLIEDKTFIERGATVEKIGDLHGDPTCWISRIDSGYVNLLENTEKVKKLEFFGSKLKGIWIAKKSKESNTFWEIAKEK